MKISNQEEDETNKKYITRSSVELDELLLETPELVDLIERNKVIYDE